MDHPTLMRAEHVSELTDDDLLRSLRDLVCRSAALTAAVLVHLGEVEARALHLGLGYASLFSYCTEALGLSEAAAYKRIQAARLCRRLPGLLDAVAGGRVHLSGLCILAPHMTEANAAVALAGAAGRSKREIEALAERLRPMPAPAGPCAEPAPGQVALLDLFASPCSREAEPAAQAAPTWPSPEPPRRRPEPAPSAEAPMPHRTGSDRRLSVAATPRLLERLERARALLSHSLPGADTAAVLERALDVLVTTLEKKRFGVGARPRSAGQVDAVPPVLTPALAPAEPAAPRPPIPVAVRRAVYERDGGRCTFVGTEGHRCGGTLGLELHHRVAFARQGPDSMDNITLHCRRHNALQARRDFGEDTVAAAVRRHRER